MRGYRSNLGGDIFVHGDCVTIGCIPLTDPGIEKIFLPVWDARAAGVRRFPVHIFPGRMDAEGMAALRVLPLWEDHGALWEELRPAYAFFEETRRVPRFRIRSGGRYTLRE